MVGMLRILGEHLARNRERSKNFYLLKAAMAAAALVARADGVACGKESRRARQVVRALEDLKIFDPGHGIEIFNHHSERLGKSAEKGRVEALAAIAAVKNDPKEAALLVSICKSIGEADGEVSVEEAAAIARICDVLGIDPAAIEAVRIEEKPSSDQ